MMRIEGNNRTRHYKVPMVKLFAILSSIRLSSEMIDLNIVLTPFMKKLNSKQEMLL